MAFESFRREEAAAEEQAIAALENSLSFYQRLWRLAAAAASWWMAFNVIAPQHVDVRQPHAQTQKIALLVSFVFCILFALGSFVQAIQPPSQDSLRWFPPHGDRGRLLKVIAVELLLILGVYAVSVSWPWLGARPTFAGLGVWIIYLTLTRNPALFRLAALRSLIGDLPARMLYVCFGLGLIAIAIFGNV